MKQIYYGSDTMKMKKVTAMVVMALSLVVLMTFAVLADSTVFESIQPEIFGISSHGTIIEAEEFTYAKGMVLTDDPETSEGKALKVVMPEHSVPLTAPDDSAPGILEYEFIATEDCDMCLWARVYAPDDSSDSCYTSVDGVISYKEISFPDYNKWTWVKIIDDFRANRGQTYKVKVHFKEKEVIFDQFILTGIPGYSLEGDEIVTIGPDNLTWFHLESFDYTYTTYAEPLYNPPAGEHPRLYFREQDIPHLIEILNHPANASLKATFDNYVAVKNFDVGTSMDWNKMSVIEAKAYYYALYGDEKVGREAIDLSLKTMEVWPFLPILMDHTRQNGYLIAIWSEVYDWCYDLLTEEEKEIFIRRCIKSASVMEMNWPPEKQKYINSHEAEAQLLRDFLSFAVATYDERPDIWRAVGGRFYNEFVPVRRFFHQGKINLQGGNYGIYRNSWDLTAYKIITGMGLSEPYPGENVAAVDISRVVYLRRPDGNITLDGDMYFTDAMKYEHPSQPSLILGASIGNNPYLKDELVRASYKANKNGVYIETGAIDEITFVTHLIFIDPTLERKSIANLPLSDYYPSPAGIMAARTGWGDGVQSNAVVAEMKIGEFFGAGHQMPAAGHFSIYYKGPLTNQGGYYDIFGSPAFVHYNHQTVASNCILVYDPDEPITNFMWGENAGGQISSRIPDPLPTSYYDDWTYYEDAHRADVEGYEIDPANPITPDYTYLKGDITKAYSDKITDYHRSMMFLNLKDDTIPAAMVVFDKLSVKNPEFKKTWVLHGQSDPTISGARTEWLSSPFINSIGERFTGKMVHDIVLPDYKKLTKTVVGGEEEGWNIVNGVNVPGNTANTKMSEENTYRLELSPTENNETELFLNVIQVTDETNKAYHAIEKVESDKFVGVKISDRVVLFSKDAKRVTDKFDVNINGTGDVKYTICDVDSGVWKVTNGDKTFDVIVTEDGGVLAFNGVLGSVNAEFVSKDIPETESVPVVLEDKQTYYVKVNNNLAYMPVETDFVNGKLMVPIKYIAVKMKLEEENGVYTDKAQKIAIELRPNTSYMVVNGEKVPLCNSTYIKDGYLMVEIRTFAEALNYIVHWDDWSKTVYLVPDLKIVKQTEEGYAEIINVTGNDGVVDTENLNSTMVADGSLETQWAASAADGPVGFVLELDEETSLENIEIVFNPNSSRTPYFEVYTSLDGVEYELIYDGAGSPAANGFNWEVFTFDSGKEINAKYVKYLAKGSNVSKWNGVKEIRFKEADPLTKGQNNSK